MPCADVSIFENPEFPLIRWMPAARNDSPIEPMTQHFSPLG
jgi:hypothetical protein